MIKLIKIIPILSFVVLFSSCYTAKYRLLDKVCVYGNEVTITGINEFRGTGAGLKGANYFGKYKDKYGVIHEIHFYEKEITDCNLN